MATPPAAGRLCDPNLTATDRNIAMWLHLSPLLGFLLIGPFSAAVPIALWLARRKVSGFDDDHGREVVNLMITGVLFFAIAALTAVGVLLYIPWCVVALVNVVRGAVAASNGEYFRYPMIARCL